MQTIPQRMRAVIQPSEGAPLKIVEINTPIPTSGQVLVKMDFASINPSDLSLLQGTYATKPSYPIIPGIEGSGIVVAEGKGIIPKIRMGKRVSCTSTVGLGGSWAEYMLTSAMHVIPISQQISMEQATSLIVNPLTAIAFIDIAKKNNHKSMLNNAAGGALGKMLVRLTLNQDIELISIVRNNKQKETLQSLGAVNVLDSSSDNYKNNLKELCHKLDVRLFFDAIGGQATKDFIAVSPDNSQIYVYANLSEEDSCFDPRLLLQQKKEIKGFFLGHYSSQQSLIKTLGNIKKAKQLLHNELKTDVSKSFPLEDIQNAIDYYSSNMSEGKVLLKFE